MPEAHEVLSDNEGESFRVTEALGITCTMAKVRVPSSRPGSGHDVVLVTRGDGAVVWVDRVCKRATPPSFNAARRPFIDEAVVAWHAGETIDVSTYDYPTQLVAAREAVRAARDARRNHRSELTASALRDAEAARTQAIFQTMDRTAISMTEIARLAGISLAKLYRLKGKREQQ